MVDKNMLMSSAIQYDQKHTVAKMKNIDLKMIKMLSSPGIYQKAEIMLRTTKANILKAADERVEADMIYEGEPFSLVIQKNDERNFDTSCNCNETEHPLCEHKTLLFLQLLNAYGPSYFDSIRNMDKEKNKLLQIYGYSLQDDLTGKFEFIYKEGKPFLKLLDASIKRVTAPAPVSTARQVPFLTAPIAEPVAAAPSLPEKNIRLGVVFNYNHCLLYTSRCV